MLGEKSDVALCKIMRHPAIAERADQSATISPMMLLDQFPVDLLRRSPNLQFR